MDQIYLKGCALLMSLIIMLIQPLFGLLLLILIICYVDMFTAIAKAFKTSKIKGFWNRLNVVKSRKIRRTTTKWILYWIVVGFLFAIIRLCLDSEVAAIWAAKIATMGLCINELYSIAENAGVITGDNIFVKIVRSTLSKVNEKFNTMIEDKKED